MRTVTKMPRMILLVHRCSIDRIPAIGVIRCSLHCGHHCWMCSSLIAVDAVGTVCARTKMVLILLILHLWVLKLGLQGHALQIVRCGMVCDSSTASHVCLHLCLWDIALHTLAHLRNSKVSVSSGQRHALLLTVRLNLAVGTLLCVRRMLKLRGLNLRHIRTARPLLSCAVRKRLLLIRKLAGALHLRGLVEMSATLRNQRHAGK